ncbi:MAG: hypothetical protein M5U01_32020 [Ardenticatenaceae bacterium]|nr:hypothetical protein [Ardenticatenaceae bacterium]HBY95075.1 hypothetical protein [Chloroflexota bacterium]
MEPCDADYDTDGSIDVGDVVLQAQVWRARENVPGSGYDPMFDPIRDGVIRVQDLQWVAQYVGVDCSGP